MIRQVFSVYDIKTELYSPPFYLVTKGEAVRAFKDLANDPKSSISKHPSDYKLVHIATFDEKQAIFVNLAPFESLGFASDYVNLGSDVPLSMVRKEH